jgi:PAS domain-containing protein
LLSPLIITPDELTRGLTAETARASDSLIWRCPANDAEESLRQIRTLFERLYELAPDAMIVVDESGTIARVNVQAEALFGFSRERGQPIEMLVPERFRSRHAAQRVDYMKCPKMRSRRTALP